MQANRGLIASISSLSLPHLQQLNLIGSGVTSLCFQVSFCLIPSFRPSLCQVFHASALKPHSRAHALAPGALTCSPVIWQSISKELLRIYCSCWLIPMCLTPFMSLVCVLVSQIHPHGIHPLSNLALGTKSSLVIARSLFCINISPPLQKHVG